MSSLNTLKESLARSFKISEFNIIASGLLGFVGHPLYWFFWTFLFPQQYDSAILRFSSALFCSLFLFKSYWPNFLKKYFYLCWFLCVAYILPFLFTVHLIFNHFSDIWLMCETGMFLIVAIFLPNFILATLNFVLGIGAAIAFCLFIDPNVALFHDDHLKYVPIYAFAYFAGSIFCYSSILGARAQEKSEVLRTLSATIAHELRNPLNAINMIGCQIKDLALNLTKYDRRDKDNLEVGSEAGVEVEAEATKISDIKENNFDSKSKLLSLTSHISDAIDNANNIINVVLADLSEKKIDPEDFVYLEPEKFLPDVISKFGYRSSEEKTKVKLLLPQTHQEPFLIKAIPERFTFIVFNLLKNALYYLKEFPDSVVTVGTESRIITKELLDNNPALLPFVGKEVNIIYVHDTGPGIPSHVIGKLFGDFYTFGKKEGTGLGLSFCRRNMLIFGGDVICESKYSKEENSQEENGWTKFSLLFPKLSEEEIKQAKLEAKRRKILIVDDQEDNLITNKSKIEKNLPYIACDIARRGKEAIEMVKQNKYQLILMDIQMPDMNGIEATKRIRASDSEIPIIAFTSLSKSALLDLAKNNNNKILDNKNNKISKEEFLPNGLNYYLSKLSSDNMIYRTIAKWMNDSQDDLAYIGQENDDYLKALQGKKVLLADDQQMNRMLTKRSLEVAGLIVTEASDGKELLEIYQNSLSQDGKSSFDLIITDINMPPHNGDQAAIEIRKIEASNQVNKVNKEREEEKENKTDLKTEEAKSTTTESAKEFINSNNNKDSDDYEIPIIALSGDGRKEDIHHFFKCQMTDYFIKGTKPEILLKVVWGCLI